MFARRRRTVPQLNATSTADISFMLLIFFLVTTSMDLDKGLSRKLPPVEKNKQEESLVNKDNIIKVYITGNNKILVDDEPSTLDELKDKLKKFVARKGRNHLIQLQASENANYDTYFHVQDAIVSTFNLLKNQLAVKMFRHPYALCSAEEKDEVNRLMPQRMVESFDNKDNNTP